MPKPRFIFPSEIEGQTERPCIKFEAHERGGGGKIIVLPSPPSIAFNDSADFNTIELGAIGGEIGKAIQSGSLEGAKSIKGSQILDMIAQSTPAAELSSFARGVVKNPNTNVAFTGNKIRTFGFNFKLVAQTAKESEKIKDVHTTFREYTYATSGSNASNITLKFPPVWTIKFLDLGQQTGENKYIPRIYSCYLTQVESTFNSDANLFFNDSAPLQVDISLQFQETRLLTREDLVKMEADKLGHRGIRDGEPSLGAAPPQKEQAPNQGNILPPGL